MNPAANHFFHQVISYRLAMSIREVMRFPSGYSSYVCPRCAITLERDFQSFCDRCGQKLDWKNYRHAKVIFPLSSARSKQ